MLFVSGCSGRPDPKDTETPLPAQTEAAETTSPVLTQTPETTPPVPTQPLDALTAAQAKAFLAVLQTETDRMGKMREYTTEGSLEVEGMLYANLIDFDGNGSKELICIAKPPEGAAFDYCGWDWTESDTIPVILNDDSEGMRPIHMKDMEPTVAYSIWNWDTATQQAVQVAPYRSVSTHPSEGDNYGGYFLDFYSSKESDDHSVYISEDFPLYGSSCILGLENNKLVERVICSIFNSSIDSDGINNHVPYEKRTDISAFLLGYNYTEDYKAISIDGLDTDQECYSQTVSALKEASES